MEEKLNILLCEDDENLGMLLREYLQAKGYNAELCPDGDAGYKAFIKNKYDICVFDVMMPKKDGFTLAKEVRAINSDVPIMFLTAKNLKLKALRLVPMIISPNRSAWRNSHFAWKQSCVVSMVRRTVKLLYIT